MRLIEKDSTNVSLAIKLYDAGGEAAQPKTGLTIANLQIRYIKVGDDNSVTISNWTSLTTLSGLTNPHTDNRGYEIGEGYYRIDVPDTAFTQEANFVSVLIKDTIAGTQSITEIQLMHFDLGTFIYIGSGDYTVTVTIRAITGIPMSGVSVWLNTSDDRSSSVAGASITNDSGVVTFNLNYNVKYYIFCHKAGYTFSSTNITPAAGTVAFTKDIGTASTTGGSNYTDSFLTRGIAATRKAIDEPATNAKYNDDDIITQIENAYALILGDVNRNTTTPVVARTTITVTSAIAYVLPSIVGSVYAIYTHSAVSGTKVFYESYGRFNPLGQSLWLEGNILHLQAAGHISVGTVLTIEYIPSGTARLHNGACSFNADGTEITLSSTPNKGSLDTHNNAYAGCILRILKVTGDGATGNYLQERTISSYDCTTRVATVSVAYDPIPSAGEGGYIIYEIAPSIHKGLDTVIALYAAYAIVGIEDGKKANAILLTYRNQMRNLRLNAYYSFLGNATKMRSDGFDNQRYRRI